MDIKTTGVYLDRELISNEDSPMKTYYTVITQYEFIKQTVWLVETFITHLSRVYIVLKHTVKAISK